MASRIPKVYPDAPVQIFGAYLADIFKQGWPAERALSTRPQQRRAA